MTRMLMMKELRLNRVFFALWAAAAAIPAIVAAAPVPTFPFSAHIRGWAFSLPGCLFSILLVGRTFRRERIRGASWFLPARPMGRMAVFLGKSAACALLILAIALVCYLGGVAGVGFFASEEWSPAGLLVLNARTLSWMLAFGGAGFLLSVLMGRMPIVVPSIAITAAAFLAHAALVRVSTSPMEFAVPLAFTAVALITGWIVYRRIDFAQ